ncbi:MAG: nitroreductase family protein [Ignavibacteriales bacterium]
MTFADRVRGLGQTVVFDSKCPDEAALEGVLEAVRLAPSTANLQPWEIVVLRGQDGKERLVEATLDPFFRDDPSLRPAWLKNAPVVLVFCADVKRVKARFGGERALAIASRDVAAAVLVFRLAALEAGLRTGVVIEFDPAGVRKALGIPAGVEPLWIVAAGYGRGGAEGGGETGAEVDADVDYRPCLPLGEILHMERW